MKKAGATLLSLLVGLVACAPCPGQEPRPVPAGPASLCIDVPACGFHWEGPKGLHWTHGCFPRCGCPDDYCPNPYPRQCGPPYPPFYRCVPAGECAHPPCVGVGNEKLTWWWVPRPRALREALWCQP